MHTSNLLTDAGRAATTSVIHHAQTRARPSWWRCIRRITIRSFGLRALRSWPRWPARHGIDPPLTRKKAPMGALLCSDR